MTEITQAQLDEWQALAEAATPGTWRVESNTALVWGACDLDDQSSYGMGYPVASADLPPTWKKTNPTAEEMFANAAFIATARTAVPALIARTKKLEAAITTLTRKLEGAKARAEKAEAQLAELEAHHIEDHDNAHAAMAKVEAENARLLVELENRIAGFNYAASSENELILERDTAVVRAEKAEAENARLREALEQAYTVLSFAFNRIHALPHSRDTALASDIGKVRAQIAAALKGEKTK